MVNGNNAQLTSTKPAFWLVFIVFLASSSSAGAQNVPKTIPKIGFIYSTGAADTASPLFEAFQNGLQKLGYIENKNVSIERRYAEGRLDRMPALVNELIQHKVDVILAANNVVIRAAKAATKTIPIVMISSVDPVAAGYVESFAHPGGNLTGLAWLNRDISAKRIELVKDILPKISRLGILWDADGPGPALAIKEYEAAGQAFGLQTRSLEVRGPNPDFPGAFHAARRTGAEALIVVGNPLMSQHVKSIFTLATKNRLPSMTEQDRYVNAGGLISYGADFADLHRRSAEYVVAILKGANPADLQVRLPEKFEISVNLKTSQELGLVIPQHVLLQADKIIK